MQTNRKYIRTPLFIYLFNPAIITVMFDVYKLVACLIWRMGSYIVQVEEYSADIWGNHVIMINK